MAHTVDALLPLSLLEAVRTVDTPEGDYDAEFVAELRSKRLGLSETVYTQIRRYSEDVKKHHRADEEEAVALARLIGRRPDAENVFRSAGRFLARETYETISPLTRQMMLVLPSLLARPIALARAKRIAHRYLNGSLRRFGRFVLLDVSASVTLGTAPNGAGCAYYEDSLRELLRLLVGGTGSVDHVRCMSRGEGTCEWRAEWRPVEPAVMARN
jgi:predicted hydrocarbon binding protein